MILVPVKNLSNAKQRLSAVLDPEARQELAQAMCEDVLDTLARWQRRPAVMLVTSDPFVSDLGERLGFEIVADDVNPGETGAIEMATALCRERGIEYTLVIPSDIPLIESNELSHILDSAPAAGSVLVTDSAGRGTNAALRAPCDLFSLRFGNDSFLPHLAAAKATGLPCVVLELPGVAMDVDRPEDLQTLAAANGERRSQRLVRSWNRSWNLEAQVCRG
ncbi:MAG TPA: 2-phospho-L-lactate guanylyltransferase [Terriglobales bacterium]|jgi:2-phospho-L-lactate guanylyltransferase|nr:2-phospho-L-lactate guanylyltransferase [Terriglobales bacterium]